MDASVAAVAADGGRRQEELNMVKEGREMSTDDLFGQAQD
jgi:hypothetical protein